VNIHRINGPLDTNLHFGEKFTQFKVVSAVLKEKSEEANRLGDKQARPVRQENQAVDQPYSNDNGLTLRERPDTNALAYPDAPHQGVAQAELDLLREVIDVVEIGTFVTERNGRIICANLAAAEALGEQADTLVGYNLARDVSNEPRLDQWQRLTEWLDLGNAGLCEMMFGGRRWVVSVSPLAGGQLVLRLEKSPELSESSRRYLRQHYKLTPAELTVVDGLLTGKAPRLRAVEKGVAESTVRTQIKHALSKTRTRGISELILKICRYPVG
jgi:DNA-binding CsgD family transcriptional regulator